MKDEMAKLHARIDHQDQQLMELRSEVDLLKSLFPPNKFDWYMYFECTHFSFKASIELISLMFGYAAQSDIFKKTFSKLKAEVYHVNYRN